MSHEFENIERASDRFLDGQSTQTGYTASYSYLVEAALDRQWEEKVRSRNILPQKRLDIFVQEEGRA
jgi:hypothetical protein